MRLKDSFLFKAYRNIKDKFPDYVIHSMNRLLPAYFISSIFEIFSLVLLFPVINVILDPSSIQRFRYLQIIYTSFSFSDNISFVLFLLSVITGMFILKNLILFFIYKRLYKVAYVLAERISLGKYLSYLDQSYDFHANSNTALLLRNFVQTPFDLINYAVLPIYNIINELFIVFLLVTAIALYDPILFASLLVFTVPLLLVYNRIYRKALKEISDQKNESLAGMYKTGMQSMEGFREIVVFGKKGFFRQKFQQHLGLFTRSTGRSYLINSFSSKIVETAAVLCIFFIFIFGYFFQKDIASLAQFLIVFSIAAFRIIPSINKMLLSFNYVKGSEYVFEYFEKSDFKERADSEESPKKDELLFREALHIRDLSFHFPGREKQVLDKMSVTIPKNSTTGIVGPSGSGKTTLLNILLRLYEEQEGGIFLDDVKIEKRNLFQWYSIVSYVPQNTILLDGTIQENIAFGLNEDKVNHALLEEVIERSLLKEFIHGLRDKLDTQIGEKGIKISGGQRQRIGIARALYHGGSILIFDEATSALDSETEMMLTESIRQLSGKRDLTIIIVAHRAGTLKYCDNIYRIEDGKISRTVDFATLVKEQN